MAIYGEAKDQNFTVNDISQYGQLGFVQLELVFMQVMQFVLGLEYLRKCF